MPTFLCILCIFVLVSFIMVLIDRSRLNKAEERIKLLEKELNWLKRSSADSVGAKTGEESTKPGQPVKTETEKTVQTPGPAMVPAAPMQAISPEPTISQKVDPVDQQEAKTEAIAETRSEIVPEPLPAPVQPNRQPEPQKTYEPRIKDRKPVAEEDWAFGALLRQWKILPPEDYGNSEIGLMQWWLPRIGGLLAVLTLIFFGVWASQGTPPWVKFCEMLGATLAVIGLGAWFVKRHSNVGESLLASGLVMLYVDAMAAYMLPPVRVIENPMIGLLVQFIALTPTLFVGWRRRSMNYLITGQVFAFVSSYFAIREGMGYAALVSAMLPYVLGFVAFRRVPKTALIAVGCIGVYLPLWALAVQIHDSGHGFYVPDATVWGAFVFFAVVVSVMPLLFFLRGKSYFSDSRSECFWQIWNSSNALLSMYFLCENLDRSSFFSLKIFYAVAAVLFLSWAALFAKRDFRGFHFQLFFLKGSTLLSLFLINHFHGNYLWATLLGQFVAFVWTARRTESKWINGFTVASFMLASFYWSNSVELLDVEDWMSSDWWILCVFPWLGAGAVAWFLKKYITEAWAIVFAVFAGVSIYAQTFVMGLNVSVYREFVLLAAIFLSLAWIVLPWLERRFSLIMTGVFFVVAHINFWVMCSDTDIGIARHLEVFPGQNTVFWLVLSAFSLGIVFVLKRFSSRLSSGQHYAADCVTMTLLSISTLVWLATYTDSALVSEFSAAWMILLALVLLAAGKRISLSSGDISIGILPFVIWSVSNNEFSERAFITVAVLTVTWMLLPICVKGFSNGFVKLKDNALWKWALPVGGYIIMAGVLVNYPFDLEQYFTWLFSLTSLVLIVAGIIRKVRPYRIVGLITLGLSVIRLFVFDIEKTATRIIAFAVLSVILIFLGYLYGKFRHYLEDEV